MARRASVINIVYDIGFPHELSEIIGDYSDWEIEHKINALFKGKRRCILKFTDDTTGHTVKFQRGSGYVIITGSMLFMSPNFITMDKFIYMLNIGAIAYHIYRDYEAYNRDKYKVAKALEKQVIDRWNSL